MMLSAYMPLLALKVRVFHALDAAHLLFDRGGHGGFNGQRIGTDIGRGDLNLRRNDIRNLRWADLPCKQDPR